MGRKLLFRGLLVAALAALGWLAWTIWSWTDPDKLRREVLALLMTRFPDAEVRVARVQLDGLDSVLLERVELHPRGESPGTTPLEIGRSSVRLDRLALARGAILPAEIVLEQCTLHVRRRRDGSWQYPPLTLQVDPAGVGLALVRIAQAKVIFEDEILDERVVWEIERAEASRPFGADWHFQARGLLDWGGRLSVTGQWRPNRLPQQDHATPALALSWQLADVPLQPGGLARLTRWTGLGVLSDVQASGWLSLKGHWQTGAALWDQPIEIELRDVCVNHRKLPEAIFGLSGRFRYDKGQLLWQDVQGKWLGAALTCRGLWPTSNSLDDAELEVSLQSVSVNSALYDKLPASLAKLCREFAAEGLAHLHLRWKRIQGHPHVHLTARVQNLSMAFEDFPYPIRRVSGQLEYRDVPHEPPLLQVRLTGWAQESKVQLEGEAFGPGLKLGNPWRCGLRLDLESESVPIDEMLLQALPGRTQLVVREFRPRGRVRVRAQIRRAAGSAEQPHPPTFTHIQAHIEQGQICYKRLPYPLQQVQGIVEVDLPAETWRAVGFSGRYQDGLFFAHAQGEPTPRGEKVSLTLQGQRVLLNEELRQALPAPVRTLWDELRPTGRVDFSAKLEWVGEQAPQVDVTVAARGQCAVQPRFFPYRLEELTGTVRYTPAQAVFTVLRARHGPSQIFIGRDQIGGLLRLRDDGSWQLELYQIRGDPLHVDKDLLAALPEGVRSVLETLRPDQPIRVVFDLYADSARGQQVQSLRWSGHASFARCTWHCGIPLREATGYVALQGTWQPGRLKALGQVQLQEVNVLGLPLREVASAMQIREDSVYFPGIRGKLFGGQIFGPLRYDFAPRREFRLDLTVAQVDLQALARQSLGRHGQAQGKVQGRIIVSGQPGDWRTLTGRGSLSITDGHIYDLPPFLNLLNLLAGQLPNDAVFHEVQTRFTLEGQRVHFSRIEFLGNALTLRGQGSMRVDGQELDLEMYALLWGRSLPLLPPGIDRIPPLISRQLWKIYMRGSLDQVVITREPVPLVGETLRLLWQLGPGRLQEENFD
ncbi:MAG: AsmA-like C-terminal region-containing protein [Gemmatales bacterium]|nr:AsmA-like C-terminal region-containing protein [Gemmatales bacterium]MDW7993094.1 AsmA-like C-terminal region-containing protein [Gemmatales bacterium]